MAAGTRWSRFLLVAAVAVSVAACAAERRSVQEQSTPTSAAPVTTAPTTGPTASADDATVALAARATLTQADLGAGWTVYAPAKPAEPVADDDCAAKSTFAALPLNARSPGQQLQIEGARWYVYSAAAVFPDETAARAWVDVRKSEAYVDCRRAELEKEQKATDARFIVATEATTSEGVGTGGYEGYTRYQLKADIGAGPQNSNASFDRHTYRVGRTVVTVSIDILSENTDPADLTKKMSDDVTRALTTVYGRINL